MGGWRAEYLRMAANGPQSVRTSILFWGLSLLSLVYGLCVCIRRSLYQTGLKSSYRASVPVVSVGNIAVGGTGKTPMVDFLAHYLLDRGVKCAIVSRGYGGSYRQTVGRVADANGNLLMTPEESGDEPYLLAVRNPGVPVYVARKRMLGVQAGEQDGAQLLLLDDGFQHLAVHRDADIVLIDAKCPFGNGRLLPAGILREPISALQRADLVVMTRSGKNKSSDLQLGVPLVYSCHQPDKDVRGLDGGLVDNKTLVGKSCLAFAGIAKPEEFFRSLNSFGFSHIETISLADHQEYSQDVLTRLLRSCHNYDFLLTTEKDAVKLSAVDFPIPCLQMGVELTFDDISPFADMFDGILQKP